MAESGKWLLDETKQITNAHLDEIDRELADAMFVSRGGKEFPTLSVLIHDVTIYDNKKWFGEADIRLDALVITGQGTQSDPGSFYMPKTASFGRIGDGETLPIGDGGLLVYHGSARHFLDIFIMVSRDLKDTENLASILTEGLGSEKMKAAISGLTALALAAPTVSAVTAAVGAAGVLGDIAYHLLQAATGSTIGLYRNSHLQFRDGFGVGSHPGPGKRCFRVKDLSFRYEIVSDPEEN